MISMKISMKKMRHLAIAGCLIPGLLLGAGQNEQKTNLPLANKTSNTSLNNVLPNNTSTSFKEVTSQLDQGGSLYLYLSLKKWVQGLSQAVSNWKEMYQANPKASPEEKQNVQMQFDLLAQLIQKSGVEDLSSFGASTIDRGGLQITKSVLYHEPGKNTGFLWTLLGEKSHPLNGLNLLPSETTFAFFTDFNVKVLLSTLESIGNSGIPELKEKIQLVREHFARQNNGLQLDQLLDSLGNEYGVIVRMDPVKTMSVPTGSQSAEIAETHGMLVVKVKDDLFFQFLLGQLEDEKIANLDAGNVKMRKIDLPFNVPLVIAQSGEYVFLSSSEELVKESLAVQSGKQAGLKTTESFKELSQGTSQQGNMFSYIDKRLVETMITLYASLYAGPFGNLLPSTEPLQAASYGDALKNGSYSLLMRVPEGWRGITQQK